MLIGQNCRFASRRLRPAGLGLEQLVVGVELEALREDVDVDVARQAHEADGAPVNLSPPPILTDTDKTFQTKAFFFRPQPRRCGKIQKTEPDW